MLLIKLVAIMHIDGNRTDLYIYFPIGATVNHIDVWLHQLTVTTVNYMTGRMKLKTLIHY